MSQPSPGCRLGAYHRVSGRGAPGIPPPLVRVLVATPRSDPDVPIWRAKLAEPAARSTRGSVSRVERSTGNYAHPMSPRPATLRRFRLAWNARTRTLQWAARSASVNGPPKADRRRASASGESPSPGQGNRRGGLPRDAPQASRRGLSPGRSLPAPTLRQLASGTRLLATRTACRPGPCRLGGRLSRALGPGTLSVALQVLRQR